MKWIVGGISVFILGLLIALSPLFASNVETDYLRIHIRANSNSSEDQRVKYMVKDAVVEALIPLLADAQTKEQAVEIINDNLNYINAVADNVLASEGFNYKGQTRIAVDDFPTRVYDDITLPEGKYQAVILDLGSGEGDNWWCLVYPAFCFTKTNNSTNYVYISKIWEIINSVT